MLDEAHDVLFRETVVAPDFAEQRDRLPKQRDAIQEQLEDLEAKRADVETRWSRASEVRCVLDVFGEKWDNSDIGEREAVLRGNIKSIHYRAKVAGSRDSRWLVNPGSQMEETNEDWRSHRRR